MAFQWIANEQEHRLMWDQEKVIVIPREGNCEDTFEPLEEGAWRWTRRSPAPVDTMRMTLVQQEPLAYWQVPAVNYNGNGWGSGAQYSGYECGGKPWTYAWHRVAIPACTYAEGTHWAVGLFGGEEGGMSGCLAKEGDAACQSLLWPEQEGPKVLFKRCWEPPFQGTMTPRQSFQAILRVSAVHQPRKGYHGLLDFAWRYFERPLEMEKTPEQLVKLDTLYFRQLWRKNFDGVTGFASGMHWDDAKAAFVQSGTFEIGWVGQNASVACVLLREYIKTGDADLRDKALSVLDSWVRYAALPNGLMLVKLQADPAHLDSIINGDIPVDLDACNLGTAATYFFKAARLAEQAGTPRPEYEKLALGICDFALRAQLDSGEFAKSWFMDGSINAAHGSVGAFMILPLLDARTLTGEQKYADCALRAFAFYYGEFAKNGFTTAGALDSYCIDKESAAPLLRAALECYHLTKDRAYVDAAEEVAYYLATWQWHYSVCFPEDSMAKKIGYDTYGGTSVSAAHNAQDPYGLYYVPEYLELAQLTGKDIWLKRARALWYNGIQLISDGTLVIHNRVRPVGSQDESVRHTRWGRPDKRIFVSSEWLVNWPGTFRQVALDRIESWDALR